MTWLSLLNNIETSHMIIAIVVALIVIARKMS